jgi:hypothetical protein
MTDSTDERHIVQPPRIRDAGNRPARPGMNEPLVPKRTVRGGRTTLSARCAAKLRPGESQRATLTAGAGADPSTRAAPPRPIDQRRVFNARDHFQPRSGGTLPTDRRDSRRIYESALGIAHEVFEKAPARPEPQI